MCLGGAAAKGLGPLKMATTRPRIKGAVIVRRLGYSLHS